MRSIILAAGVGSRLRPITNYKPKTLVEVNGKPMLGYLIDNLVENGIKDIVVCIGYKGEQIKEFCINNYPDLDIKFVDNKDYLDTNNMYSLYLAREYFNDDIILMNSDLVYESMVIGGLLKSEGTSIAVDKGTFDIESMKVIVNEKNCIVDIAKIIKEKEAFGRSIDVYKIVKEDLDVLGNELINIIENDKDLNQWTEVLLQKLFKNSLIKAKPYEIGKSKWVEIDNYEDLYYGELLFNKNIDRIKNKKLFLLDKDGTLTLGKSLINGANDFVELLIKKNKKYCLLSNNSSKTINDNLKVFNSIGLNGFDKNNFILSTDITLDYFKKKKIKRVYILGNNKVLDLFKNEGFIIDKEKPQALLLTYDTEINYEKMCIFHNLIKEGIPYYATHIDYVCPTENGDIPDIGSFIKLFETSTSKNPINIFGKPSKFVLSYLKEKFDLEEKDIVIVGDRLYTDINQKKYGDILSVLVLTGESKREDVEFAEIKPDLIVKNLKELSSFL